VAVSDLVDKLLAMATVSLRIETDPSLMRPVDTPVLVGSHHKLSATTGWAPQISLDQTLADLLDDWRSRLA
jgi:GDP-4-dehydro-6-deoxy-D-mannose reductase